MTTVGIGVSQCVRNSSFSDGAVSSLEYAHHNSNNEDQQRSSEEKSIGIDTRSLKGKKSKKKGRKSKNSTKKEQSLSSTQSAGRSQASKRRRAHILQRIRSDSLNTSSDEEHLLSCTSSDSLLAAAAASDSVFVDSAWTDSSKDDGSAPRNTDEVKEELKRRIFSKKPPTYFETPGMDPIFHEVRTKLSKFIM